MTELLVKTFIQKFGFCNVVSARNINLVVCFQAVLNFRFKLSAESVMLTPGK